MKTFICLMLLFSFALKASESLEGVVEYKKEQAKGVLFIFAKKFDGSLPMPLAVKRIENPKFPLKFTLSAQDAMMKSIPFEGPFKVTARLSTSGNALDKSGPEVETQKALGKGAKGIKLVLP